MKGNKQIGMIGGMIAVFTLVSILSITYASFTSRLEVTGSGTVASASWKIRFLNLTSANLTGKAAEITQPSIVANTDGVADTHIGDYAVTFKAPGDAVSYVFDVKNEGTFDAVISSINIPATPTVTGTGTNKATDEANVAKYLSYTLTYSDGTAINVGDTLAASESKTLKLTLAYSDKVKSDELPKNDVAISGLATTITYAQA